MILYDELEPMVIEKMSIVQVQQFFRAPSHGGAVKKLYRDSVGDRRLSGGFRLSPVMYPLRHDKGLSETYK